MADQQPASIEFSEDHQSLFCEGGWTLNTLEQLEKQFKQLRKHTQNILKIDASKISRMDSAGALLLQNIIELTSTEGRQVGVVGLPGRYQSLLKLIASESGEVHQIVKVHKRPNWFHLVGAWIINKHIQTSNFLSFVGELMMVAIGLVLNPKKISWRSIVAAIDITGYQALPIVGLMSLLIGVVLAYQLGSELRVYGANIYVVDTTGIAILREFAPLITSIIVAGRTSTAFAALIGTMKVGEEIDALHTMGVSPIERLVIPRIVGLVLALPLLVVWADIFGVLGSMIMSKAMLDINYLSYLQRFTFAVGLKNYILGLIKAPIFAMIIASVGCFQGFQVGTSAESVGAKTTKAAVQAIFLIIVADAAFSIIFSKMGY